MLHLLVVPKHGAHYTVAAGGPGRRDYVLRLGDWQAPLHRAARQVLALPTPHPHPSFLTWHLA